MTAQENPGGWPSVPGVPLNPERDGWHLLRGILGGEQVWQWSSSVQGWPRDGMTYPPLSLGNTAYLGEMLSPASVAALVEAARVEGFKTGTLAAADLMDLIPDELFERVLAAMQEHDDPVDGIRSWADMTFSGLNIVEDAIRALPLPSTTTQRAGGGDV